MNSREKGKRGERQAAEALKSILGWQAFRSAQVSGKFSADLLGVPAKVHCEVKFYESIAALRFMAQAVRDAKPNQIPFVVMRENKSPDWVVMVRLKDLKELTDVIQRGEGSDVSVPRTLPEVREQG
jgi:Holliday junction resolvase